MPIGRRKVLYFLACASGWPVVKGSTASTEMTEKHSPGESISDGSQAPMHHETSSTESLPAERVLGIGGLFFRARDPKSLAKWYRDHLGVGLVPSDSANSGWHTEAGPTAFQPFSLTSKYLGDAHQMWMVNFRVRSLDRMAAQLRSAGIEVTIDPQSYPFGRFARIHDPEQNPIELWEPAGHDVSRP
jgi:predicted enzyme related to lactoylglutathione lyase